MNKGVDLQGEARRRRDLARRARRMALGLSQTADRIRVNRYADELEKQAAELEARAAQGPPIPSQPTVTHQQQQVQQQQSPEPVDPEEKTKN
jgi:hypothetical protein